MLLSNPFWEKVHTESIKSGFCGKFQFSGQNPKIGYQKFNSLQTPKLSKK